MPYCDSIALEVKRNMPKPKCDRKKKGVEIVSIDTYEGIGYCCCMLGPDDAPEEVGLCWFEKDKLLSSEVFNALEAAKVGGALVYAATLVVDARATSQITEKNDGETFADTMSKMTDEQIKKLLENINLIVDPLGQELIKKALGVDETTKAGK